MPLSEHEQRMLKEIESALYAEDPKFASSVRKTGATGPRRPTGLVVALGLLGVALLVGGLAVFKLGGFPILSLIGFLLMFAAGVLALRSSPSHRSPGGAKQAAGSKVPGAGRGASRSSGGQSYSTRMEDRFRRRFNQEP